LFKEVDKLRYLIRLQLIPGGKHNNEIEELIIKIPDLIHESKKEELKQAIEKLVVTTQSMLKDEWSKVKNEAQHVKYKV
jgi:hypothetical protein